MNRYKMLMALALAVFIAISGFDVLAHAGAEGIVKHRMMQMKSIGKAMKSITVMMRKSTPYDADQARTHVQTIKTHSGKALTDLFPKGSLQQPTEATPEIWSEWQEFAELADQLTIAATVLESVIDKDHKQRAVALQDLGKACSSCHKSFRKKK